MTRKLYTSRRKSDGKPRKLRKATHPRARRRQARRIVEARLGRKLKTGERVHHGHGLGRQTGLTVESAKSHARSKNHLGKRGMAKRRKTRKK